MILPTIYEDPPIDGRFTAITDYLERSEAHMRETKRKIDQTTMTKSLRKSIRLTYNDTRISTKNLVQNLQQPSPPKRASFRSYLVLKENNPAKLMLSSRPAPNQGDYTNALQQAFQT